MTIDDISALKQAHALLKGRHLAEFIPTGKGISACYFNAVQAARRIYSESIGACQTPRAGLRRHERCTARHKAAARGAVRPHRGTLL